MKKVIVVGGGAAGMMAAIAAGEKGHQVTLLEKNEKLGKKIYITGKGRCNVTNACDVNVFFDNVISNEKFLYSSIYGFDSAMLMSLIESAGTPLKIERGNRVFPKSDRASDITKALKKTLDRLNVNIVYNTEVTSLILSEDEDGKSKVSGVKAKEKCFDADSVIMATGGLSYPSTGSNGQGHRILENLGINITDMRPALTDLLVKEDYVKDMQGLSLKNITFNVDMGKKKHFEMFGELLFTHRGVSGPVVLTASSIICESLDKGPLRGYIDLKPALSREQLDKRLLKMIDENRLKHYNNFYKGLLPQAMIPVMIKLSAISSDIKCADITKADRGRIIDLIKGFPVTITGTGSFKEAVITKGGVDVRELSSSTMEFKKIKGLYAAGELIDVDAKTGGFNLQIAFSTGHLAGSSV